MPTVNGHVFDVLLGQGLGADGGMDARNYRWPVSLRLMAKAKPTAYDRIQNARLAALEAAVFPAPNPTPPGPAPVPPSPASTGDSWAYTGATILDQGAEGECGGYGSVTRALCEPKPIVWNPNMGTESEGSLQERVYLQALKNDGWNGQGSPDEQAGASPDAIAKANVQLGIATAYHWCFGEPDVRAALALGPVDLAIPWTEGMFTPDANGIIHATGAVAGGHWITCHALDPATNLYELVQTWGPGWGRSGYAKISATDLATLLKQQGQAASFTP